MPGLVDIQMAESVLYNAVHLGMLRFVRKPWYKVIEKDGLNFVHLYMLNYTWHVNGLHNV